MHTIKRHGNIIWAAENVDSGPYYLTGPMNYFPVGFGSKSIGTSRPGSIIQRESFETSKVAFEALSVLLTGEEKGKFLSDSLKAAARVARGEWKKYGPSLAYAKGASAGFERAVINKLDKELTKLAKKHDAVYESHIETSKLGLLLAELKK